MSNEEVETIFTLQQEQNQEQRHKLTMERELQLEHDEIVQLSNLQKSIQSAPESICTQVEVEAPTEQVNETEDSLTTNQNPEALTNPGAESESESESEAESEAEAEADPESGKKTREADLAHMIGGDESHGLDSFDSQPEDAEIENDFHTPVQERSDLKKAQNSGFKAKSLEDIRKNAIEEGLKANRLDIGAKKTHLTRRLSIPTITIQDPDNNSKTIQVSKSINLQDNSDTSSEQGSTPAQLPTTAQNDIQTRDSTIATTAAADITSAAVASVVTTAAAATITDANSSEKKDRNLSEEAEDIISKQHKSRFKDQSKSPPTAYYIKQQDHDVTLAMQKMGKNRYNNQEFVPSSVKATESLIEIDDKLHNNDSTTLLNNQRFIVDQKRERELFLTRVAGKLNDMDSIGRYYKKYGKCYMVNNRLTRHASFDASMSNYISLSDDEPDDSIKYSRRITKDPLKANAPIETARIRDSYNPKSDTLSHNGSATTRGRSKSITKINYNEEETFNATVSIYTASNPSPSSVRISQMYASQRSVHPLIKAVNNISYSLKKLDHGNKKFTDQRAAFTPKKKKQILDPLF